MILVRRVFSDVCYFRFRWVSLQLDNICDAQRVKHEGDIRAELGKLPKTLNDSYAVIYERIKNAGKTSQEIANNAIKWLLCSMRLLDPSEFLAAVSTCSDGQMTIVSENELLDMCCNLIILNDELATFQFAHLSVREYFELCEDFSKVQANTVVLLRCIDIWNDEHRFTLEEVKRNNALKAYAILYWPFHCQILGSDPDNEVKRKIRQILLSCKPYSFFQKWMSDAEESDAWRISCVIARYATRFSHLNLHGKIYYLFRQIFSSSLSPLFLICSFGLSWVIHDLDNFYYDAWNQTNIDGNSGLGLATLCCHKTIVQFLLQRTDVDINIENQSKHTSLSLAAQTGQEAIMKLLLRRSDIIADSKDWMGQTPLSLGAEEGYALAVQLLIDRTDVSVDSRDASGRTPLSLAAMNGHIAVVRLLLQRSNLKDHHNQTAILMSARYGHEAVMRMLLEHNDIEVNFQDHPGRTSLSLASESGHESIVKLLLGRKEVNINLAERRTGGTALSYAASRGHEKICRPLLKRNEIDADFNDYSNRTPLSMAAEQGHEAVVQLLLELKDVDVNSKNWFGQTPFCRPTMGRRQWCDYCLGIMTSMLTSQDLWI